MSIMKKKTIIILTVCMVVCFILYQVYFFIRITSEVSSRNLSIKVFDDPEIKAIPHQRSEDDKFINSEGVLKGVLFSHMPKYRPDWNNKFKCLKSEQMIPFEYLNDDFCDCDDGTDEPSTSACVDGTFFCDTQHHKKAIFNQVPSSQVNDGICDCCDGSDEWLYQSKELLSQSNKRHYRYYVNKCPDTCKL